MIMRFEYSNFGRRIEKKVLTVEDQTVQSTEYLRHDHA